MARINTTKTSFTGGEISATLLGRTDMRIFDNGAGKLRNIFIQPTGGVIRRSGLRYVATARGRGRLVCFEFSTEQIYLLVFTDGHLDIFKNNSLLLTLTTPWSLAQLAQLGWTQSADTLLLVHPDVAPKKLTRAGETDWRLEDWVFEADGDVVFQPYHKFIAVKDVTLTPSTTSGTITLTASAALFVAGYVGTRFRIGGKQVLITAVTSSIVAQATVKQPLANSNATKDWEEQAFSAVRGWPVSVCFHQDRLVIGGARDLPNRLWLSKSSDLFNFELGTGLDDESIEFAVLSDQVNAIRAVFSGRHLQVFTSGAEWMVTGDPLTPSQIQLKRQTRIGSPVDRMVPPRYVDGATQFVARNGHELREFVFADLQQTYQSNDLAILARHLINDPVDMDYDQVHRLFHLVMADGTLGTVTIYRSEQVTGWTLQDTEGVFLSVAVVDADVYLLVARTNGVMLERFDASVLADSAITATAGSPQTHWTGLGHLEGQSVKVVGDGTLREDHVVQGGALTLLQPASAVQIGLPYSHVIEPLPPTIATAVGGGTQGAAVRLIEAVFRLYQTQALRVDTGHGFSTLPFKRLGIDGVLDTGAESFSGDKRVRAFGWRRDKTLPLWKVTDDAPLACAILSVTTQIGVND